MARAERQWKGFPHEILKFGLGSLFYLISRDYSKLNPDEYVSVLILFLSEPSENVIYKVNEGKSLGCAGKAV